MSWPNRNIEEIQQQGGSPPKSVIVKLPTIDSLSRLYEVGQAQANGEKNSDAGTDFENTVRMMHNDECAVYKFLDGHNIVPMPRCFLAVPSVQDGDRGLLILEDMTEKGVGMQSFSDFLSLAQTYEVTQALASLHAWSAKTALEWTSAAPKVSDRECIYNTFTQMTPMLAAKVHEKLADQFDGLTVDKIVGVVNKDSYLRMFDVELTPRTKLPMVLVHGDVHCMNVMFEKSPIDGRAGDKLVALYDFQLAHCGYGTEDLARLMTMGTSTTIRRQHGDAILNHYVEVFNDKVGDSSKHVQFEDVKAAYEDMFSLTALWIGMTAAIAEDFLKKGLDKINDEEEKRNVVETYVANCVGLYEDAANILGW